MTHPRLVFSWTRPSHVLVSAILVLAVASTSAQAAKNPDKPDKPNKFDKPTRIEKIEEKLERAGLTEAWEQPASRPAMAATPSVPSAKAEKSSKSERGDSSDSRTASSLPPDPKFDTFRVVVERNIFNPNRTPRRGVVAEEKPPRIDEISLVGTMQYDKGLLAFFDSADSEFRKTLREGGSVAGFSVRRIAADGVELVRENETVTMKIGQQLRRAEGGDWVLGAASHTAADARTAAPDDARAAAAAAATEIPPDASEVLKRLMKQRQKQSK
jgi:hypothetical protein